MNSMSEKGMTLTLYVVFSKSIAVKERFDLRVTMNAYYAKRVHFYYNNGHSSIGLV